ncbi:MAG: hypothetical protein ACI4UN_06290, partial [Muribaculaceae bacterium]
IALLLASCSDEWQKAIDDGTIPDMTGEQVAFTTNVSSSGSDSRGYSPLENGTAGYIAINKAYNLKITMHKQGEPATEIGTCTYEPVFSQSGTSEGVLRAAPADGETALYWQDSQSEYGFSVTAGSDNIATDQSDEEKWLAQDRLKGFSYAPVKDEESSAEDNINAINYRTSKQWYQANKVWMPTNGIVPKDDFKKIPLFLQHERAWITVILRAGVGVDRNAVDYATAGEKIKAEIYNYNSEGTAITPWLTEQEVAYNAEDGLPEETRKGVAYHAIVNPYDYLAKAEESIICKINLSGQNFSFYASNDKRYGEYKNSPESQPDMKAYNLTAGKHLVIDVTLSRESRKILITAYVEDWTEKVTSSVCDDFGLAGTPIVIQNRDELLAFLSDPTKNKAGQTAIISANSIDLDKDKDGNESPWSGGTYNLNATLNIGGCTLSTSSQFLKDITASGQILNGSIAVKSGSNVETVVCNDNYGSISYLDVTADATSTASKAGIAVVNYGNISRCSSAITVEGASGTDFVGGIAAKSIYQDGDITVEPIIDRCTVTGRVGVAADANTTYGGGISGLAAGRVTNCTYEYGISLLQEIRKNGDQPLLLNIVNKIQEGKALKANGNEWSTRGNYTIGSTEIQNNRDDALLYDQIIYCQAELNELVKAGSTYNASGKRYRIAQSFTVTSDDPDGWPFGFAKDKTDNSVHGNVLFYLEGNGMTITLTGSKTIPNTSFQSAPMLFNNIVGTVQNLNVYCAKSLYGIPQFTEGENPKNNFTDGCAPFAYAIYKGGKAENITVYGATGTVVQAASAGGVVVSLHDGAQMINCNSFMNVNMYIPASSDNDVQSAAKFYSGGIAAMLEDGTTSLTQCRYMGTLSKNYTGSKSDALFFLGGIVGGLRYSNVSEAPKPHATITDCSSWWRAWPDTQASTGGLQQGSLIGRARYSVQQGSSTNDENGMYDCEGNWWIGTVGAGSWKTGNEALAIGKKNSVTPTQPTKPTPPNQ